MFRRLNCFASSFAASASSCGISVSSISTIVTSLPKVLKIEANSQPMIPPPSTTSRRGTSVWASSPVESTHRSLSSPGIGGRSGNDPVATIADLKVTSSPPSTEIVFASLNVPLPFTHSTPFALKRPATPCVICFTTAAFHSVAAAKSSSGSLTFTPSFANESRPWWMKCAVWTHAFVGMQPTRRQVPPSSGSFSMQATFAPSWAARIAAVYPPGPPPRTATSHSTAAMLRSVKLDGIHHVTCITGNAPANVEFYAGTLGLRLVKKTVNQDDPTVYHLFYADEIGSGGARITFFECPGARRGRAGAGMVHRVVFRVGSIG